MKNNSVLAKFLSENVEKENIISEVFKLFNVDCITRCQFAPSELDSLIKAFNENDKCDISVLEEIITFIKGEQKNTENQEKELILKIRTYISNDYGETWSDVCTHDSPCVSSKIYCGELSDGRHYLIASTDKFNRSKLTAYFTDDESISFTKELVFFDIDTKMFGAMQTC